MTGVLPLKTVIGFVLFVQTTTDVKANVSVLLDTCTITNTKSCILDVNQMIYSIY